MSAVAILSAGSRSDSPAKPDDSADVPLEDAHQRPMETEEPLPLGITKIKTEPSLDSDVCDKSHEEKEEACKEQDKVKVEPTSNSHDDDEELHGLEPSVNNDQTSVVTEEMIKEEKQLEEEALKKEKKMEEDQEKLWSQMTDQDRDHRYQRLKFLLSKSNMYTQYLIDRMKRQTDEEAKKKERQLKRMKRKEEKDKEQKTKDQETTESGSQSSQVSESSTRSSRKRKSDLLSPDDSKITKNPGKKARKKGVKDTESSQTEVNENSQDNANEEQDNKGDNSLSKEREEMADEKNLNTEVTEEGDDPEDSEVSMTKRVINGEEVLEGQPVMFSGGVLRKYQIEGYSWLKVLFENGVNGILADEMGLGKTVQCVALIAHLMSMGVSGPFLVVGPLSTVPNWYNEFRRFSPKVPVILYHGTQDERQTLRLKIRKKHPVRKNFEVHPVIITSYEIAMNDRKYLSNFEWKYLIVDEGHRLKNTHCRLIRELRMYRTTHRLLLTGTPLQNNLAELWSLLNFLLPEIFDDLGSFEAWFDIGRIQDAAENDRIIAEEQRDNIISMLHQILTPFMLRRLKSDVELFIPPKREVLVMAPLTQMQKEYYSSIVDKTILDKIGTRYEDPVVVEVNSQGRPVRKTKTKKIDYSLMVEDPKDDEPNKNKKAKYEEDLESWFQTIVDIQDENSKTSKTKKSKKSMITVRMQNSMMQLRKCCNHPYLLEHPIEEETGHLVADESIVKHSGKMLMLDRLLPELKKRGHKVLIFSQMTTMLNILESYCELRNHKYCRLDGSRSVENRGEQIKSFNEDPKIFIFLVSTRAGGLGINLTAADTVIIYDSDWNPQSDLQAQDRCHRIGQTRPVLVYRFVTANTIDQRIVERAAAKRKLEKLIIHKGKFKTGMKEFSTSLKPISPQELLELLRSRDHEGVVQLNEKNIISKKDLENLLDRQDLYRKMEELRGEPGPEVQKGRKSKSKSKPKGPILEGKVFKVIDEESGCYTNQTENTEETSGE